MAKFLTKLLLTLLLLGFVLHSIDFGLFWKAVWSVDIGLLSVAILLFFPAQFLSAYRWYFVLSHLKKFIPFRSILCHNVLGQLSTFFLPGQISGDVVRILAVTHGQSGKATLALSVIVDKIALLLALATFALGGMLAQGPVSQFTAIYVAALGTVIVILPILLFLCQYRTEHIPNWLVQTAGRSPYLRNYVLSSIAECLSLPQISIRAVCVVQVMGLILLLLYTLGAYFVALSMHIVINPIDWLAINAIVSLVQILPLTLGGLGVREGAFSIILSLYAVPITQAVAFSLTGFILVVILTAFCWLALNAALRVNSH